MALSSNKQTWSKACCSRFVRAAQGHDISEMSYKIRVMLSHLRQKTGFKATANTCKKSVECASRPQSFLAKGSAYDGEVTEGKH